MEDKVEVHMRDSDAFSWYMEKDPLLRSTVVVVLLLDGTPDWERLPERIEYMTRMSPGFRHKVVHPPLRLATPRWVVDSDFDVSWHVRRFEAAEPRNLEGVLEFARKTGMAGLDRDRPLWECTFIDGLDNGQTGVVLKVHHSLTDGVGGMDLAAFLFDLERKPKTTPPLPEAPEGEDVGTVELVKDALSHDLSRFVGLSKLVTSQVADSLGQALRHPRRAASEVVATGMSIAKFLEPVSETLSPLMIERKMTWRFDVLQVPLQPMLDAAHAAGVTHNDAFLSSVTAGLRRYHEHHNASVGDLRVTLPISIRKDDDPIGGNRITLMRFKVPAGIADPRERMVATHECTTEVKHERSIPFTNAMAGTLNLLPRGYVGGMLKHIDFLASNVPGIPVPFYLAGAKVEGFYGFGPTIGAALNVTLMSYQGVCNVGVNMDAGAISDPDLLMQCLREGFDEVLSVGGADPQSVLPAHATG